MKITFFSKDGKRQYSISVWENGTTWISTEDGEGMGVKNHIPFDIIDKYFKENM